MAPSPLQDFLAYFLRLGTFGFGGPIALAARMELDLVESRGWVARQDYVEGLAFAQLSPGPLAAQLAMYLGWVRAGAAGAALVSLAFILPSFLMALAIAAIYVHYGQLSSIQRMFYGVGAAVIAIIVQSAFRLTRKTLGKDPLLWALFVVLAVTTLWAQSEFVWLIILCGLISLVVKTRLSAAMPAARPAFAPQLLLTVFLFFLKAGAFIFGSGLAIVPFLYGGVVGQYHWLTEQQFVDAVAVAMITPGPVVITAAFIGYLTAGAAGAIVASTAVFVPPLLIVILGAPYYRRFAKNESVKAFVKGVTAAAVGAIAGSAVILGRRSIVDLPTLLIAACTLIALLRLRKIPEPFLILAAAAAGLILHK